ncbi:MAG: RNA methyltransferase [Ferruginibacter sp.]
MQVSPLLLQSLQNVKGFNEESFVSVHASGEQVTSIRINPAKYSELSIMNAGFEKVPWSTHGYYLNERPSFTSDPAFHAGAYYVQEASSMFLEEAVKQTTDLARPLRVLDLCAAPGGKSTLLQSIISKESLLVSNEIIKSRVTIVAENLTKWGAANVVVTNNDPGDFRRLPDFFDLIVVDAPCSGSGLFRKDPGAQNEWSPNAVQMCSQRQQRILENVIPSLIPGGILIYSTCSYSAEENEFIAELLLSEHSLTSLPLIIKKEWGIVETGSEKNIYGYRFYPDKVKGEGLFIAAFKKEACEKKEEKLLKNKFKLLSKNEMEIISPFINDLTFFHPVKWKDEILAIPMHMLNDLIKLQSSLYIKKAGVKIGTVIREELIPDHELAVSTILSTDIDFISVDLTIALNYLRRNDVVVDTNKKGWMLLKYNDLPLGWIKNLGSRINNYYPKEWRILNR